MKEAPIIIIAGPTASGKSAFAIEVAHKINGVIINADSQQVYKAFRVLTARPSVEEEQQTPHLLYGHVESGENYSAGIWASQAANAINEVVASNRVPILVGGSGLYIKSLVQGISDIPAIPAELKEAGEKKLSEHGVAAMFAELAAEDPKITGTIDHNNKMRVLRAWLVWRHTGKAIRHWHGNEKRFFNPGRFRCFALAPPREKIYENCNRRVNVMLENGALDEVRNFLKNPPPENLPIWKTHGVPEFTRYLSGKCSLEQAVDDLQKTTRHYVKRQLTWLKHQQPAFTMLASPDVGQVASALALA